MFQVLAPALNDDLQYHVFFLYHAMDRDWVLSVIEKLESSTLGFRCCCHERDLSSSLSQPQGVLYGMKNSLKTVCLLTPEFVSSTWATCEGLVGEIDAVSLPKDIIAVLLKDCEIPAMLSDLPVIEVYGHGWWTKLLARLALPGTYHFITYHIMLNKCSLPSDRHPDGLRDLRGTTQTSFNHFCPFVTHFHLFLCQKELGARLFKQEHLFSNIHNCMDVQTTPCRANELYIGTV